MCTNINHWRNKKACKMYWFNSFKVTAMVMRYFRLPLLNRTGLQGSSLRKDQNKSTVPALKCRQSSVKRFLFETNKNTSTPLCLSTKRRRHRCAGWAKVAMTPKFLAFLVILCFERQCPKQNTVARLKSTDLFPLPDRWCHISRFNNRCITTSCRRCDELKFIHKRGF